MQIRNLWIVPIRVFSLICFAQMAQAQTCYAPERPFVPTDPQDLLEFRDLISNDFETYIANIQGYFRCLDEERSRAFEEGPRGEPGLRKVPANYQRLEAGAARSCRSTDLLHAAVRPVRAAIRRKREIYVWANSQIADEDETAFAVLVPVACVAR